MASEETVSSGRRWSGRRPLLLRIAATVALLALALVLCYGTYAGFKVKVRLAAKDITQHQGLAYMAPVPAQAHWPLSIATDSMESPNASTAVLREDGRPLGPRHKPHAKIAETGGGSYSHWGKYVYFSSSDGTDPRVNGKRYRLTLRKMLAPPFTYAALGVILVCGFLVWLPPIRAAFGPSWHRLTGEQGRKALAGLAVSGLLAAAACFAIAELPALLSGALLWIAFGVIAALAFVAIGQLVNLWRVCTGRAHRSTWPANLALIAVSAALTCAGMELYLGYAEAAARAQAIATPAPADGSGASDARAGSVVIREGRAEVELPSELIATMESRRKLLTLPRDWELIRMTVPNTKWAYTWHGILHIHDDNGFRRYIGPFPAKGPDVFRILVVGDSMTYGDGIPAEWTYAAQLERLLQKEYRVEIISLGADGAQSEDILHTVEKMLPVVRPDLVIYGVCYNDFLPSGIGQYDYAYFPLPEWLKKMVKDRTRLGLFFEDSFTSLLVLTGFSLDFYDDILKDFSGYQQRFGADVAKMNAYVRSAGLPPVVGMPLDQFVQVGGRGHQISRIAEDLMRKAGFDVVSLEGYYEKYNGQQFRVSRWEGHPNEEAYAIFAALLGDHLMSGPYLEKYRSR